MHPRSSSTTALARTVDQEPLEGGAVLKTQRVGTKPTTRTYIGQAPILGYSDVVNEENQVYPFFKKDQKVPIIDTHINRFDPYHVPVPGAYPYGSWTPGVPPRKCLTLLNYQLFNNQQLLNIFI